MTFAEHFALFLEEHAENVAVELTLSSLQHVAHAIAAFAERDSDGYSYHSYWAGMDARHAAANRAASEGLRDERLGLSVARWADDGGA